MVHTAIVGICGSRYRVGEGKTSNKIRAACSGQVWAGRIRGYGRILSEDLLRQRSSVCLQDAHGGIGRLEIVGLGKSLKQFESVVGKEEKSFVFLNGSTDGTTKLVLDIFRPFWKEGIVRVRLVSGHRSTVVPVIEEVVGIECCVAVLLIQHAMKLIRARFLVRGNDRPCAPPILCPHNIGNEGKILNGLQWRVNIDGAGAKVVIV